MKTIISVGLAVLLAAHPALAQIQDHSQLAKTALESFGGPLIGCDDPAREENKAKVTRRAAYLMHQVDPSIGLLSKTTGNNVQGLSVDLVINRVTGGFADMASDDADGSGCFRTKVVWIPNQDATLIPRWVQPTAALAGLDAPAPPPPPPPPVVAPPPPPVVVQPQPPPVTDIARLAESITRVEKKIDDHVAQVRSFGAQFGVFMAKYGGPIIGALLGGYFLRGSGDSTTTTTQPQGVK